MSTRPALLSLPLLVSLIATAGPALAQVQGAPAEATYPAYPPPPPPPAEPPPALPPQPPLPPKPTPWRLAITFGAGTDAYGSYFIMGGTVGYQPVERLELFLDGQYWSGSPSQGRVAAGANWYPPLDFGPYLGGYYAHWFVGGNYSDSDAIGVHAGVSLARTRSAALLAGVAWEHTLSCTVSCDTWWPELSIGVRF